MKDSSIDRPVFLMCPPDHFSVRYRINPWMQPDEWAKHGPQLLAQARAGWQRLVETLRGLGASVVILPAQPELPDLVFTANAAVVLDGTALLARFRFPQRRGEEPHISQFFEELRATGAIERVVELPEGMTLEGAGDCVWDSTRQLYWIGYGPRSDATGSRIVQEVFGTRVIELELVDPRYYHLDTCLCVLDGGHVLYVPEAFSMAGLQRLYAKVPESHRIPVRAQDAEQLAVNAVCIGRHVVLSQCSAALRAALESAGYGVHEVHIPQFALSGGSVCCLTLRLDRRSGIEQAQLTKSGWLFPHDVPPSRRDRPQDPRGAAT